MFSFLESPVIAFVLHEIICIMATVYYLLPLVTRLKEKKAGNKKFTTSWEDLKNIVATYVIIIESYLVYDNVTKGATIQPMIAIVTQVITVIVIFTAFLVLRDKNKKRQRRQF